jgi:hypothetical protein
MLRTQWAPVFGSLELNGVVRWDGFAGHAGMVYRLAESIVAGRRRSGIAAVREFREPVMASADASAGWWRRFRVFARRRGNFNSVSRTACATRRRTCRFLVEFHFALGGWMLTSTAAGSISRNRQQTG